MVDTVSAEEAVRRYQAGAARAPQNYADGINRTQGFVQKAIAGEENWKAGVTAAAGRNARAAGLSKISDSDWKNAASTKGAARIGAGMNASLPKFRSGITQNLATIQAVQLPPRGQDGLQNLISRAGPIVQALQAQKRGQAQR